MVVAVNPMDRDLILRELTRHLDATIPPPPEEARGKLEVAELSVDLDAHRVTVDDVEVVLTSMEFKLLVTLIERRDAVQSRATLLRDVWRMSARSRTRTVDTHVKRLRDKLGTAGRYFHSVRGVGYRLSEDVAPRSDAPPASQREEGDRSPVARVVRRLLETA
jgi:two-component system phosphate regulon response regulator PhoB